jgi:hypothetical protein
MLGHGNQVTTVIILCLNFGEMVIQRLLLICSHIYTQLNNGYVRQKLITGIKFYVYLIEYSQIKKSFKKS